MKNPHRNKPCPCGSGKKSKKCCRSAQAHNEVVAIIKDELAKLAQQPSPQTPNTP